MREADHPKPYKYRHKRDSRCKYAAVSRFTHVNRVMQPTVMFQCDITASLFYSQEEGMEATWKANLTYARNCNYIDQN
jgi:hypothetical protein